MIPIWDERLVAVIGRARLGVLDMLATICDVLMLVEELEVEVGGTEEVFGNWEAEDGDDVEDDLSGEVVDTASSINEVKVGKKISYKGNNCKAEHTGCTSSSVLRRLGAP